MKFKSALCALGVALGLFTVNVVHLRDAHSVEPRAKRDYSALRTLAIQAGGRMKPLDSFAREQTLLLTGSRTYGRFEPVELILSWLVEPQEWEKNAFIPVGRIDVRKQLGLDESRTRFSPQELFENDALRQYATTTSQVTKNDSVSAVPKANPRDTELKRVFERLSAYRNLVSGDAWTLLAPQWESLAMASLPGAPQSLNRHPVKEAFISLVRATQIPGDEGERAFSQAAQALATASDAALTSSLGERESASLKTHLKVEAAYNRLRPHLWTWILYLVGGLCFALFSWARLLPSLSARTRFLAPLSSGLIIAGFLIHSGALVVRSWIAGRPPVTNMYESIVWVSFGAVVFGLILFWRQKSSFSLAVSAIVGAITLIAADAAPTVMDPGIHPLVPVLRSNLWLTVHVLTITLGYAAFMLSLGISNVTLFQFLRGKTRSVADLNVLTYRAVQFGVVLLAAGTILGGVWADYSWGRFWGWDPKETWALIALMAYVAILHARYTGWMGPFGFAAWTVIAFLTVLMAWYGVNFVLGAGLHSYGFSTGGLATVSTYSALQLLFVIFVAIKRRAERGKV